MDNRLYINGCELVLTCYACPEQYDMYIIQNGAYVCIGYFRLRHGSFYAEYVPNGAIVYNGYPKGDGCFDEDERMFFLEEAVDSLLVYHNKYVISKIRDAHYQ